MKKQLKRTAIGSTMMIILAIFALNLTSCKKKEERKPADFVVGEYLGSGVSANLTPFVNKSIRVVKVSKRRVRIEPVGHSYITAFETDIEYLDGAITYSDGNFGIAFELAASPMEIGFGSGIGQSFVGEKQ